GPAASAPPMRPPRALGHVDCDAFYVSAERVRDCFRVGALCNQSACVIAKRYDLKATNRKSGEPIGQAPREKRPARQGDGQGNRERPPASTPGVKFKKVEVMGLPAGKRRRRNRRQQQGKTGGLRSGSAARALYPFDSAGRSCSGPGGGPVGVRSQALGEELQH